MAAPTTPMSITADSQERVIKYLNSALTAYVTSYDIRNQLLRRDKEYYRTNDLTPDNLKAKAANASGDASKMQNITVPVVEPQVETALTDLQETFLTGYPIFGIVGPPGEEEAMEQMETQVGENSIRAAWPLHLVQTMRDGLKYDLGAVEVVWEKRKTFAVVTPQEGALGVGTPKEEYYEGNFMKRLDPYNTILDARVSPEMNHLEGEFAGYTEMLSRINLKKRMEDLAPLGTMNFTKAFESPGPSANTGNADITAAYYIPEVNPDALLSVQSRQEHNWLAWVGLQDQKKNGINYRNSYEWTVLYARILPSDFGINVPARNTVQIWKFIIINRSVVIFAERQTNAHNYLPIIVCKPSCDGLSWQSKSFAENATPYQQVATSLVSSGIESQRRKVYDRVYYDASRVNKKDMDQVSSVARIPVKNTAYGKAISEAVYESPYRDEGVAQIMAMAQQFVSMGEVALGQNRVQQGQFQKGNKTRKEFDTVMGNAGGRGRLRALNIEFSFFVPIKIILLSNILQYQPPTTLVNSNTGGMVKIDPTKLRQAHLRFSVSDGYLPSDKMISSDMLSLLFQSAPALPTIAVEYDLMGALAYSMQLQGGGWLRKFKRDQAQQQEFMGTMQQASVANGTAQPPQAAPTPPTGA